jgi:hypothetical protein
MGRIFWQFVGNLLLVGFVGAYFWWIVAAAAVVGLVYYTPRVWRAYCVRVAEREAEHAAIVTRADQQHAWVLQGDDRGVYGPDGSQLMHYIRSGAHPTPAAYALTAVPQWV